MRLIVVATVTHTGRQSATGTLSDDFRAHVAGRLRYTLAVIVRLHEITIVCSEPTRVGAFWAALLGGIIEPMPGWRRLERSTESRPLLHFQPVPETKLRQTPGRGAHQ